MNRKSATKLKQYKPDVYFPFTVVAAALGDPETDRIILTLSSRGNRFWTAIPSGAMKYITLGESLRVFIYKQQFYLAMDWYFKNPDDCLLNLCDKKAR